MTSTYEDSVFVSFVSQPPTKLNKHTWQISWAASEAHMINCPLYYAVW